MSQSRLCLLVLTVFVAATTARKCPAPALSSGCCCCSGLCLYATCPPCSCPQPPPGSTQPICSLEKLKRRFNVYKEVGTRISSQQGFDVDPGKTTDVGHPGQLVTAPPPMYRVPHAQSPWGHRQSGPSPTRPHAWQGAGSGPPTHRGPPGSSRGCCGSWPTSQGTRSTPRLLRASLLAVRTPIPSLLRWTEITRNGRSPRPRRRPTTSASSSSGRLGTVWS